MWHRDAPIIARIDENDVYKVLMMYLIWKYYPNLRVTFTFKNRSTQMPLAPYVDLGELREQFENVANLRFTDEVLAIYREWGMFPEEFLQALKELRLTVPEYSLSGDQLFVRSSGSWFEVTYWETLVLSIVSELSSRPRARAANISEQELWNEGNRRLDEKIEIFRANPGVKVAQFGMRRRFSGRWEEHVTRRLIDECPDTITGVSNMYLAHKLNVDAQGTNAHELPMALVALARHRSPQAMREAPHHVLTLWQRLYGHKSLIILDDAYGSDLFRTTLPRHYLEDYRGFRHDSGDPVKYGEHTIALYERHGIDPKTRVVIFSDALTPQKAVDLFNHFNGRILTGFGIGTNLTNDLGIPALSIVMKLIEAAGNPVVKLSNNVNKATGDPQEVAYVKQVFGYTNTASQKVLY